MMATTHRRLSVGLHESKHASRCLEHAFRIWEPGQLLVYGGSPKPRNASPRWIRRGTRPPGPGFTLLEVLIVGVLTSTLMIGVWSLFHTWGRLYERGERRVRQAQLERSLSDQFTDDVRSVAYVMPPPREGKRSNSDASRQQSRGGNRALVGGADWMVLDLIQPPNPFALPGGKENSQGTDSNNQGLQAPELQRVMYTFQPPESEESGGLSSFVEEMAEADDSVVVGESEEAASEPFSGLLRIAIPVERHRELTTGSSGTGVAQRSSGLREATWALRNLVGGRSQQRPTNPLQGNSRTSATQLGQDEVPEVTAWEFRYYDGSGWTSSWDSRAEGQLPQAVELRFKLRKEGGDEPLTSSDGETERVEAEPSGAGEEDSSAELETGSSRGLTAEESGGSQAETPYFRCVVCLRPRGESRSGFNGE
ncbi:MAG: type II secretion system protein GspJ [Planctomycetota bacterium]